MDSTGNVGKHAAQPKASCCRDSDDGGVNRFARNGSRGPAATASELRPEFRRSGLPAARALRHMRVGRTFPNHVLAARSTGRRSTTTGARRTCTGCAMRKLSGIAIMVFTAALIASPATAYADCGDPGQDPCTGPVPTVDQVVAIMAKLTDPGIPAANKTDIVTPGFAPDEAGTIDDHLNRMLAFGGLLPLNFVVTDIRPAPADLAGATLATTGGYRHATNPRPIVLADEGGHWLITHDNAMTELDLFWYNATRYVPRGRFVF
jgi:hypothetical protein